MRMRLSAVVVLSVSNICSAQWTPQESGTKARLRGLSVVSREVAWASGNQGTCLRTTDGGKAWIARPVSGASSLDFRDIHAIDADVAYLLSIGAGERSRIYKTDDGGATWTLQYKDPDPKVFLDAVAFWDAGHGLALGDPVDGRFVILATDDGGKAWSRLPFEGMPPTLAGEGAFAASGTCLVVTGDRNAWFGTGGASVSRVFRSTDRGRTWTVHETPVRAGTPSSGIFSLAFRDENRGVAIGGDYKRPGESGGSVARTTDGGRTWIRTMGAPPAGYRSCVVILPGTPAPSLVAVGPTGSDLSDDDGEGWRRLGPMGFHAVGFAGNLDAGWAVGEDGMIAKYTGMIP